MVKSNFQSGKRCGSSFCICSGLVSYTFFPSFFFLVVRFSFVEIKDP
jgi:hypothetical protein